MDYLKNHKKKHFSSKGRYLKSGVYGGLDGIITTFAIVAGVIGAGLSSTIILILGFANLIADGISMAMGDYLSIKSEGEYYNTEKGIEKKEAFENPKMEKRSLKSILFKKGFNIKDAEKISTLISKNKKYQVEIMLHEELGLLHENVHPMRNASVTFFSFFIFGVVPLLFFLVGSIFNTPITNAFLWASLLSGISMFSLGAIKSRITKKNWIKSGGETLLIGGIAATAAYFVGDLLSKII